MLVDLIKTMQVSTFRWKHAKCRSIHFPQPNPYRSWTGRWNNYFFTEKLFCENYQVYLKETAKQIVKEQSPRMLAEVIKDIPIGLFESGKRVENVQHMLSGENQAVWADRPLHPPWGHLRWHSEGARQGFDLLNLCLFTRLIILMIFDC